MGTIPRHKTNQDNSGSAGGHERHKARKQCSPMWPWPSRNHGHPGQHWNRIRSSPSPTHIRSSDDKIDTKRERGHKAKHQIRGQTQRQPHIPRRTRKRQIPHGQKDGIHLTTESSQQVALLIENHLQKTNVAVAVAVEDHSVTMGDETVLVTIPTQPTPPNGQAPPENPTTTTTTDKFGDAVEIIETDARRAAKIIGLGGNRIEKFKLTHRVKVDTTYTDNKTVFIIRGKQDLTTKAKQELNKQLDELKRVDERRDQVLERQINVTYRFHQAGYYRFGTRCKYRHDQGPIDIPTPPPHQPNQASRNRPEREDDSQREPRKPTRKPENKYSRSHHDEDSDKSRTTSPRRSWRPRPSKPETRPRSRSPLNEKRHSKDRLGTNPKRYSQHQNIEHRKDTTTQTTKKGPNPAQDPIHTTRTTDVTTPATMTIRKDPTTQTNKKEPNPAQDLIHTTRTTDATTAATMTTRK